MKQKYFFLPVAILSLLFTPPHCQGQEIDNTSSYRNIPANEYIRLTVDNDYFTGTDMEYTEGVNFELCMKWVKDFPLSKALVHPDFTITRYGIGLEQAGYTPNDLGKEGMQTSDRPFAATLFLKTFVICTDPVHQQRFATTLSTGVIGPMALGDKIQDVVHQMINNVVPPGWKYQIPNDVVLNYQVDYQKQLFSAGNYLLMDAEGTARAGTLNDKAGVGLDLMAGYFESPFGDGRETKKDFHIYLYDNPEVDAVAYDATMEGGIFNHTGTYLITPAEISRFVFMNKGGIMMQYKKASASFEVTTLTKQFSTGPNHAWGSITLALAMGK